MNIKQCEAAEPGTVIWDDRLSGFGLRVSKTGVKTFIVQTRLGRGRGARPIKLTVGHYPPWKIKTARDEAQRLLLMCQRGEDPRRPPVRTVSDAFEEWMSDEQADKRTRGETERIMRKHVIPTIGSRNLTDLTRAEIRATIRRIDGITANRALSRFSRMLNWCVEEDLIAVNPAKGLRKPVPEVSREHTLTDEELVAVWRGLDACNPAFRDGVRLLILTAGRRDEIFSAHRDELRENTLILPPERCKTNVERFLPLSPPAMEIVESQPVWASGWLISQTGRTPFSGFSKSKRALDRASGVTGWHLHDLRRTAATGMQRLDIRLEHVEAALGHKGERTGVAGIYQRHDYREEARAAVDQWGRHMMALLGHQQDNIVAFG